MVCRALVTASRLSQFSYTCVCVCVLDFPAITPTYQQEKPFLVCTQGCGGQFTANGGELFLGNAGTAMRPLTAAVAAAGRGK